MKQYYKNRSITKDEIRVKYLDIIKKLGVLVPESFVKQISDSKNIRVEKRYLFQVIADCDVNIRVEFSASKVVSEYDHLDSNGKSVYKDKTYYNSGEDCYQFQRQLVGATIVYDEAGNIVNKKGIKPDTVKQIVEWSRNRDIYTENELDVYKDMKKRPDIKTIDQALSNRTALEISAEMAGTKICAHAKDTGWPGARWSFKDADILRHYDENEFIAVSCHYYVFVKYNGKEYLTTFDSNAKAMDIDYPNVPMLYFNSEYTNKKVRELFVQEIKKHGDDVHGDFLEVIKNPENIEISNTYRYRVIWKKQSGKGVCVENVKQLDGFLAEGKYYSFSTPQKINESGMVDLINSYNKMPYTQTPTVEYDTDSILHETADIKNKDLISVSRKSVTVCVKSNGDSFYSTFDMDKSEWTNVDFQPSQKMISREIGEIKEKYDTAKKSGYFGGGIYSMLTVLLTLFSVYTALEVFFFNTFDYVRAQWQYVLAVVSLATLIMCIVAIVRLFPTSDGEKYVSGKRILKVLDKFNLGDGDDVGKGYTEEKKHSKVDTNLLKDCLRLNVLNERKRKRSSFLMLLIANIVFYAIVIIFELL